MSKFVGQLAVLKTRTNGALCGFKAGEVVYVESKDDDTTMYLRVKSLKEPFGGYTDDSNLLEYKPEFKVGDIIAGTPAASAPYRVTTEDMTKGIVRSVSPRGTSIRVEVMEGRYGTRTAGYVGEEYGVMPEYFVLVEAAKAQFNVGDIVQGTKESDVKYGITNSKMKDGLVVHVEGDCIEVSYRGITYRVEAKYFELSEPKAEAEPKKQYIRMIGNDIGYKNGDILELIDDGKRFIDKDGDTRLADAHDFELVESTVIVETAPTTRQDVIEYLSEVSPAEILDIIALARK